MCARRVLVVEKWCQTFGARRRRADRECEVANLAPSVPFWLTSLLHHNDLHSGCGAQVNLKPEDISAAAECFGLGGGSLTPIVQFNGAPVGTGKVGCAVVLVSGILLHHP